MEGDEVMVGNDGQRLWLCGCRNGVWLGEGCG